MDPNTQQSQQTTPATNQSVPLQEKVQQTSHNTNIIITILTLLLLIIPPFFPVGLILMWFVTRWNIAVKIIVTIISLIAGIVLTILLINGITIYKGIQKANQEAKDRQVGIESSQTSSQPKGFGVTDTQKKARNELRKLDLDTLTKILEVNYGTEQQNMYPVPKANWFASGKIPTDPSGGSYIGVFTSPVSHFKICANLEDETPNQYCIESKN